MEDDTELISNILRGGFYAFNSAFQQSAGTSLESSFPETSFSSGAPREMASYPPLSLDAGQLLPSETPCSSQSLNQGSTFSYGERDFGMNYPHQLNANFGGYKGPGDATGLYARSPGGISSGMGYSHWPGSLQKNYMDLGQYAHQLDTLFECSPAYKHDVSAPPTTPDTQSFDLTPQMRASTIPRSSLESPTPAMADASLPPVSPAGSMESCAPISSNAQLRTSVNVARSVLDPGNFGLEDDTDADSGSSEEPYARLIFRALMSVPGHKMALKDIYDWFEKHTNKAKNSDTKGWQNSIRHNLSMNAAFEGSKEAVSIVGSPKKGPNVWVLTEEAIKNGVQSTTRYRKQAGSKKSQKSEHPAPQRQRSGAKGGRAAKKSAKTRRVVQDSPKREQGLIAAGVTSDPHGGLRDLRANYTTAVAECRVPSIATPRFTYDEYDISRIIECANLIPDAPVFNHNDSSSNHTRVAGFPISTAQAVGPNFNCHYQA